MLYYYDDLTYRELAVALKINAASARRLSTVTSPAEWNCPVRASQSA